MAKDIVYTEQDAKAVRLKIDLRILPIIILTYICLSLSPLYNAWHELILFSDQRTSSVSWLHRSVKNLGLNNIVVLWADRTNMYVFTNVADADGRERLIDHLYTTQRERTCPSWIQQDLCR